MIQVIRPEKREVSRISSVKSLKLVFSRAILQGAMQEQKHGRM